MMRRTAMTRKTPMARGTGCLAHSRAGAARGPGLAQRIAEALGLAVKAERRGPSVFRSRAHSKKVAALDCICCGRVGRSQAAHLNLLALGKGKGLKVSDALQVPLCCDEPGRHGCHPRLDQGGVYGKVTSAALQILWLQETRDILIARGQWPAEAEADMVRLVCTYLARSA
jgi:hypothetical protein